MSESDVRHPPCTDLMDQLVDRVAILACEAQTRFSEDYAGLAWRVNLGEPAAFWFERDPQAVFTPQFVGSVAHDDNTWLWGWENINEFPDSVIRAANTLHELADTLARQDPASACAELLTSELPLDRDRREDAGLPDHSVFAYALAAAAVSEIAEPVCYIAPTGGGEAWFLLENPEEFQLGAPTPLSVAGAITQALQQGLLHDHRAALRAYAARRTGLALKEDDARFVLSTPTGEVTLDIDRMGRVAGVSTRVGPAR